MGGSRYNPQNYLINDGSIEGIINNNAVYAATAGVGAAWIPGAGGTVAAAAMVAIIWKMYYDINVHLNIKLSKNILKFVATAVVSNIAGTLASYGIASVISFVPVVGTFASIAIVAVANYGIVTISGKVYCGIISSIGTKEDINSLTEEELKKRAEEMLSEMDLVAEMKDAKKKYKSEVDQTKQ